MKNPEENITFEQAMEKLEEYTGKLSQEGISLDEAIQAYEEGVRYYGICARTLDEAKQKIEMLEIGEDADD
jgi:exodeoxyribonuclease VII small subunit